MNNTNYKNSINLLDTSICTDNLGDLIIVDSILNQLDSVISQLYVTRMASHDETGPVGRSLIEAAPISLLLGTNALTSKYRVNKKDMWRVRSRDIKALQKKVLLCGVGWRDYQGEISYRQKKFYQNVLTQDLMHSVRDSQAERMLKSIGITNVVNTSCPTTWSLTPEHCRDIPKEKADTVVFTLTAHKSSLKDQYLVHKLFKLYDKVFFWPQQPRDLDYLKSLCSEEQIKTIGILPPSVNAYDKLLESNVLDYIGTRLHGGIRALHHKRRALIVSIDNRATEISRDINLPVIERDNIDDELLRAESDFVTSITLPDEQIDLWKSHFNQFFHHANHQ